MPYLDDNLVVFTDLDGSLLDHHDYSWQPAQAWLDRLRAAKVPVVLTTSKTAAEVAVLQTRLALTEVPFIAENGALIGLPQSETTREAGYSSHVIGRPYEQIREILLALRQRYDFEFRGFGDVSVQQVIDWTGLPAENATLAMQREASEPLVWFGNDLDFARFEKCLQQEKLALTRGGRFWHVMGVEAGKASAMDWVSQRYQARAGKSVVRIALGDGPNDIGMLNAADFAVVIRGHHENDMPVREGVNVYRSQFYGPEGWKEGLDHFIDA